VQSIADRPELKTILAPSNVRLRGAALRSLMPLHPIVADLANLALNALQKG
jgi:hypothetical protein